MGGAGRVAGDAKPTYFSRCAGSQKKWKRPALNYGIGRRSLPANWRSSARARRWAVAPKIGEVQLAEYQMVRGGYDSMRPNA